MPGTPALRRILLPLFVLLLLIAPTLAQAQAVIKVNDTINVKFGLLLQGWADEQQDAVTRGYAQNLFLRRIRFLVGGQITPNLSFFFETDNPNDGKAPKSLGTGFITQDAFLEWKPTGSNAFIIDGGLFLPPLCRNCLVSAATILPLDYNSWSFVESTPTQSVVGRDTGFQFKGYVVGGHLEYRAAVFSGFRAAGARNPFRTTARVQYNVFDTESGYTYPGLYFGNKHILAAGVGADRQQGYKAYTADVFLSEPTPTKSAFNGDVTYYHFDGGSFLTAIPSQRDLSAEAGYYFGGSKLQPFARWEKQHFSAFSRHGAYNHREALGLTWFPNGHNFNVKGQFQRVTPRVGNRTNEYTIQAQVFYY
jgi:hypothetical protein